MSNKTILTVIAPLLQMNIIIIIIGQMLGLPIKTIALAFNFRMLKCKNNKFQCINHVESVPTRSSVATPITQANDDFDHMQAFLLIIRLLGFAYVPWLLGS